MKFQARNTKIQTNSKFQCSKFSNGLAWSIGIFDIEICLGFEISDLEFGTSANVNQKLRMKGTQAPKMNSLIGTKS